MAIDTKDITKEHIEYALDYIVRNGQRGRNDIFYLHYPMFNRGIEHEVNGKNEYVSVRETVRIATLYAMQEIPEVGKVSMEATKSVSWVFKEIRANSRAFVMRLGFQVKIFSRDASEGDDSGSDEQNIDSDAMDKALSLLRQIGQIIFYGPPGTGKTFLAKKMLPDLLDMDADEISNEKERWSIVQFHPSYNYEDFVRGVKVKTDDNKIAYETVNRIFGSICKRAKGDPNNDYALIIDEINRANVSAVLGELIYGLEYRGEQIETPYAIEGDSTLIIPENLYIIGTMNTADRTIGQIDYAVRRRFAFVHCQPNDSVIQNIDARDVFFRVDKIFDKEKGYMSPDYDADDVRIGHSYFLAKGEELAHKIVYQVVPILREYVKDGVLLKGAEDEISAIERKFSDENFSDENYELEGESDNDSSGANPKGSFFYYWEKDGRYNINGIGRTVLSITKDYVSQHREKTIEEVQAWFPDKSKESASRGIKLRSEVTEANIRRFFNKEEEQLNIGGQIAYVTNQWGEKIGGKGGVFADFKESIKKHSGYTVSLCHVVRVEEKENKRGWEECRDFGFVSVNDVVPDGQKPYSKKFKKLDEGDIVFAFLKRDADDNRGFIGLGKVLGRAAPIKEFKVNGIPLLDCLCADGKKYRDKYPVAVADADDEKKRDWILPIDWIKKLDRKDARGTGYGGSSTYWVVSRNDLEIIKEKFDSAE